MTSAEVGAQRVVGPRLPETHAAHEDGNESAILVGANQGAVAEAVPHTRTLCKGQRLTPRATTIRAAVDEDVNILGQVSVVVLAFVGGHNQRTVVRRNDGWDAVVLRIMVAGTVDCVAD